MSTFVACQMEQCRQQMPAVLGQLKLLPSSERRRIPIVAPDQQTLDMDWFVILGGVPLRGEVTIRGAKNAALPTMAAALLTDEPYDIRHVPDLSDVRFMALILESTGAKVKFENGTVTIHVQRISLPPRRSVGTSSKFHRRQRWGVWNWFQFSCAGLPAQD